MPSKHMLCIFLKTENLFFNFQTYFLIFFNSKKHKLFFIAVNIQTLDILKIKLTLLFRNYSIL